jgi:hypothetical protein
MCSLVGKNASGSLELMLCLSVFAWRQHTSSDLSAHKMVTLSTSIRSNLLFSATADGARRPRGLCAVQSMISAGVGVLACAVVLDLAFWPRVAKMQEDVSEAFLRCAVDRVELFEADDARILA